MECWADPARTGKTLRPGEPGAEPAWPATLPAILASKVINYVSDYSWECQFQRAYKNSMFKLIQKKINELVYCDLVEEVEIEENKDGVEKYRVLENA